MRMRTPHVNPVGLTVTSAGYASRSRRLSLRLRVVAAALAILFAATVITSGVVSLGAYCLTSDGGDTRHLAPRRQPRLFDISRVL